MHLPDQCLNNEKIKRVNFGYLDKNSYKKLLKGVHKILWEYSEGGKATSCKSSGKEEVSVEREECMRINGGGL